MACWFKGYSIGGLGAHWMWVASDVHTSCYSLSMACLRYFSPSLFFLCFCFVLFCFFWGGLEAVDPGQVHSPLAAFLVIFYALGFLVISVVFGLGSTWIIFVLKWIKRGNLCRFLTLTINKKEQLFPQVACSQRTASTGSIWGSRIWTHYPKITLFQHFQSVKKSNVMKILNTY